MKSYFSLFSIIFIACIVFACTGNSSAINDKLTSTSATVSDATVGGGKNLFYEYKLTTSSKQMKIQSDTKMYVSAKGNMRSEMYISNPAMHNGTFYLII